MNTAYPFGSEINHRDVIERELRWLLHAVPLWSSDPSIDCVPLSKICNGSVSQIADYLAKEWAWHGAPKRLGRRFESLMTALLEQTDTVKLLKHGLVIQEGKQTVGELDYLIATSSDILHLEVAIKFYAGIGYPNDRQSHTGWIGPSCQDRLDRKVNHICSHQLPLSGSRNGLMSLHKAGLPTPTIRLGLIYGYLLHPWTDANHKPDDIVTSQPAFWCTYDERLEATRKLIRPYSSDYGWTLVNRNQWISTFEGLAELPNLLKAIRVPEQADCYVLCPKRHVDIEKLRLFIMPESFRDEAHISLARAKKEEYQSSES